jgi:hypothetical protein
VLTASVSWENVSWVGMCGVECQRVLCEMQTTFCVGPHLGCSSNKVYVTTAGPFAPDAANWKAVVPAPVSDSFAPISAF